MNDNILIAEWPASPGVVAGTSLRTGGVSEGVYASLNLAQHVDDSSESVAENRRRFAAICGLPDEPVWLNQTHSTNVAVDAPADASTGTDALVTGLTDHVCIVLTADCLPVVFAAVDGSEIGIAHAGWRGLCAGILEATIARMRTSASDLICWLGPAISQAAFEVGPEVRKLFEGRSALSSSYFVENDRGRFQADLVGLASMLLHGAGVAMVYGGDYCTFADRERFFSYRRNGQCGRMGTFIYRTEIA